MRIEEHVNLLSQNWKRQYGCKVMKVGLSIGVVCPNRANGGCIFCISNTFTSQAHSLNIEEQINSLLPKIQQGTDARKFVAYFQDETSTAGDFDYNINCFKTACESNKFVEIIISTRPDYVTEEYLSFLSQLPIPVTIELGMQTIHDRSLLFLNRNHTHADTIKAIELCKRYKINVGIHLIVGIPYESFEEMKETIRFVNSHDIIKDVKFHNLVVYKESPIANMVNEDDLMPYSRYIETLGSLLNELKSSITVSRLFTSNILKDGSSLYPFPQYKRRWLFNLWNYLKKKDIFQGKNS